MPRLTVVTYNTFQERKGRDPALDALLGEEETLVCLQEVKLTRALGIKRALGSRAYVSLAKYGLLYLALVLPEGARFLGRRTATGVCSPRPGHCAAAMNSSRPDGPHGETDWNPGSPR